MIIYTDREQKIDEILPPEFLQLHEKEIGTPTPITVKGQAEAQDDLLILTLEVATEVGMPCSICNVPTKVALQNKDIIITIPLSEIPSSAYDCTEVVREEVVMLLPQFVECKEGACPMRKEIKPFLKQEKKNFPFADLG